MSMASPERRPLEVLVIGGGQAGLAMGYHLTQHGRRFEIVDAAPEVGQAWRSRWDSLRLFTSGRYENLPGLPFPAAPDAYPGKEEVADYLQSYAAALELSASRTVELAVSERWPTVPQRPLGRDVWSWAMALRLDRVTAESRLGRRLSKRDQVIGAGPNSSPTSMGSGSVPV